MPPPKESLDHRRTHNLLLISRLLSLRDNASPFTLLLDTLSQSAKPVLREYISRAAVCPANPPLFKQRTFSKPMLIFSSPSLPFFPGREM